MSDPVSHNHHVVPQLFLRGFAAGKYLCEHRRDGSVQTVTVKKATVVPDFYATTHGEVVDDALEEWFGKNVESPAADIIKSLRKGHLPVGSDLMTAATFVAFQMVRGPALRRHLQEMGEHLGPYLFGLQIASRVMETTPGWEPSESEVRALVARAAAHAPAEVGQPGPEADMRNMVREAHRLQGLLAGMHWSTCASEDDLLIVGDTPAVAMDPVNAADPGVVTLPEMFEVVMPVSPRRVLVVSPFPEIGVGNGVLSASYAAQVNAAAVRACETSVFHHPEMPFPADLVVPAKAPSIPIPVVHIGKSAGEHEKTPMTWPDLAQAHFKEAIELLGGDPEVD